MRKGLSMSLTGSSGGLLVTISLALMLGEHPSRVPQFSAWSEPVNLGQIVNSSFNENQPALSRDELSLYFASNRPGGLGLDDIWVTQRQHRNALWETPINLGRPINTEFNDFSPNLSRDKRWIFLTSDRPGGMGNWDLWVSSRLRIRDDFDWSEPQNLGPSVNSPQNDAGAGYLEIKRGSPQLFFASDRPGGQGLFDIYLSELLADGIYSAAVPVPALSSPSSEARPAIRLDGLEIFMTSNRSGTDGNFDLWVATRASLLDLWSVPANVGPPVNGPSGDLQATLSSDGRTMIFVSGRAGGVGGQDLYMTTREKLHRR
jgi:hypothetical protein